MKWVPFNKLIGINEFVRKRYDNQKCLWIEAFFEQQCFQNKTIFCYCDKAIARSHIAMTREMHLNGTSVFADAISLSVISGIQCIHKKSTYLIPRCDAISAIGYRHCLLWENALSFKPRPDAISLSAVGGIPCTLIRRSGLSPDAMRYCSSVIGILKKWLLWALKLYLNPVDKVQISKCRQMQG